MSSDIFKRAPHNPPHPFLPNTLYMLRASIYQKESLISSPKRKREWIEAFLNAAEIYKGQVMARVILHNHYHAIAQSPEDAETFFSEVDDVPEF